MKSGCGLPERTIYRHLRRKAMVHTVCHTQPVNTGMPAVFGRREKGGKMLIRSQDGNSLFNLENLCIGIDGSAGIVAMKKLYGSPSEIHASLIGKYTTREKAMKAVDMIVEAYKNEESVFDMPQDYEVNAEGKES